LDVIVGVEVFSDIQHGDGTAKASISDESIRKKEVLFRMLLAHQIKQCLQHELKKQTKKSLWPLQKEETRNVCRI